MPQQIQSYPLGLNSFLGIKGGLVPQMLADGVMPTMGVEHFYASPNLETVTAAGAGLSVVDTGVNITVPANEAWRLFDLSFTVNTITAASAAFLALVLAPAGGSQVTLKGPTRFVSTAAASNYRDGLFVPQPIVLAPGSILGAVIMEAPAAGTFSIGLFALIQRFKV